MTATQIKIAAYGGLALLAWWLTSRRSPKASVELGVGTVDGIYGNDTYIPRPSIQVPEANPVTEAIERSRRALEADRLENPELYE